MIRGVQIAVSSMRTQLARQEVLERNLTSFFVPGYKREGVAIDGFAAAISRLTGGLGEGGPLLAVAVPRVGSIGGGTAVARPYVDFTQGELEQTGRPLDVALDGEGFLQVRSEKGDFYSRGGPLRLDSSGALVTTEGYPVLSEGGEVVRAQGAVSIGGDGTVSVDGEAVARLSVVEFPAGTRLAKVGLGLYTPDDPETPKPRGAVATQVMAGFLEGSNVDQIATMSEMMFLLRAYTAAQRMLQAQDQLLGKAVEEVGRI